MKKFRQLARLRWLLFTLNIFGCGPLSESGPPPENAPLVDAMRSQELLLEAVTPAVGSTAGGLLLTLAGQNFSSRSTVTIDGLPATDITVLSGSRLTAQLPAKLGAFGKVPVTVENPDGKKVTRDDLFSYFASQLDFPGLAFDAGVFLGEVYAIPRAIVAQDFNGDGRPDLAVAMDWSDLIGSLPKLRVFLNDGSGSFQYSFTFDGGYYAGSLDVADFNEDGKADIVATGSAVRVGLGDGEGRFFNILGANRWGRGVAVGDFNRDRHMDFVITGDPTQVAVYLGDGTGLFSAAGTYSLSANSDAIVVGDWNGDQKLDCAAALSGSDRVTVLLGDGAGGFTGASEYLVGSAPRQVVTGDFNRDGKPDLAAANWNSDSVSVLLGDGAGGFASKLDSPVGTAPRALTVGDWNRDGSPDLAVANSTNQTVTVLFGHGDGGFFSKQLAVGTRPNCITTADFNGDNLPDLAVGNAWSQEVSVLLGDGNGGFPTDKDAVAYADTTSSASAAADLNGDHNLDLIVGAGSQLQTMLGDGRGHFSAPNSFPASLPTIGAMVVGDWNGDRKVDLAYVEASRNSVRILFGDGSGGFVQGGSFATPAGSHVLQTADLDRNGNADLLVGGGAFSVLFGDGTGSFSSPNNHYVDGVTSKMVLADINCDGNVDLAYPRPNGIGVRYGGGTGNLGPQLEISLGNMQGEYPMAIAVADWNFDKKGDFIASFGSSKQAVVSLSGPGGYALGPTLEQGFVDSLAAVGDFDGDGLPDVALVSNTVGVYLGSDQGGLRFAGKFSPRDPLQSIYVGDFNNDQRHDIVTTSVYGGVRLLLNLSK